VQDTVEIVVRGGGCGAGTGSSAGAFERRQRDALPRCTHNTTVNQELQYAFPPLLSLPPSLFSISISPSTLPLFSLPPRQDGCRESQGRRGASACEMKHAHARVRMPEKRAHATHQDLRKVYCSSTYQDLRSFGLPQMEQPLNLVCGQHESRQPGPGQPYNTEDGGSDARPCGRVRLHCTLRRLRHDHGKHVMRGGGTHWRDSAHLCVHAIHKGLRVRKSLRPHQAVPRTRRAAGPAAGAGPSSGGVPSSAPPSSAACVSAGVTALAAASSATALVRGLTAVCPIRLRRHDAHARISRCRRRIVGW
jgi:hypothetical protein